AMIGPVAAAAYVAAVPAHGSRPVTADAADAVVSPPCAARTHEPMLIGEVGSNTRSMLKKRSGRRSSAMSSPAPTVAVAAAVTLAARARRGRRPRCATAASSDDAPDMPPQNR